MSNKSAANCAQVVLILIICPFIGWQELVQGQQTEPDSKPKAILEKSASALDAMRDFEYNVDSSIAFVTDSGVKTDQAWGHVVISRKGRSTASDALIRVEFREAGAGHGATSHYSYDGFSTFEYTEGAKEFWKTDVGPNFLDPANARRGCGFNWGHSTWVPVYIGAESPRSRVRGHKLNYLGHAKVRDVNCDIVEAVRSLNSGDTNISLTSRWFISVDDSLPRRIEKRIDINGDFNKRETFEIYDLRSKAKRKQEYFRIACPAGYEEQTRKPNELKVGYVAPYWEIVDGNGKKWTRDLFRGDLVLMDFWGTWCEPCVAGIPHLQEIKRRFSNRGVQVLGFSTKESDNIDPAEFLKSRDASYRNFSHADEIATVYGVTVYPTIFLISDDGSIIHKFEGHKNGDEDKMIDAIEKHLESVGR